MRFDMGRAALILSFAAAWFAGGIAYYWGYSRGYDERSGDVAQAAIALGEAERQLQEYAGLRDQMYDLQNRLMRQMEARANAVPPEPEPVEPTASEQPVSAEEPAETAPEPSPQLESLHEVQEEPAETEPVNEPVSEGAYAQLHEGMEYNDVVAALGREEDGTLTFGPAAGHRSETRVWRWTDAGGEPLELTLNFEAGRLVTKTCSAPWASDESEAAEKEAG